MMITDRKTFCLRYVGARFEGPRLPLDMLADLSAFRDLLVSYAKDMWRKQNQQRARLPRGFDKSISFDLVGIDDGSAMPRLNWNREVAQTMLPDFTDSLEDLVENSYKDLIKLFDEAGHERFPSTLSPEYIRALKKFGGGLQRGERIEFLDSEDADGKVVDLDAYRRKILIDHVPETYQVKRYYNDVGRLLGQHLAGYIDVQTPEYGSILIPVDPARVSDEFDGHIGSDIFFSLHLELDTNMQMRDIIDIFDVQLIDSKISADVKNGRQKLKNLSKLSAGWHNGEGKSVNVEAVAAADLLLMRRPSVASFCRFYPTEMGGILLEFEKDGWDLSLEFGEGGTVEMYGVQIDGDEEIELQSFRNSGEEFFRAFDARFSG